MITNTAVDSTNYLGVQLDPGGQVIISKHTGKILPARIIEPVLSVCPHSPQADGIDYA